MKRTGTIHGNARSHGKPAFNNESGREIRHKNDNPVHRRKQAWIWYAAGCHWTWHSWESCEGIDDTSYCGLGQEFMKPATDFFRELPFWRMDPNFTIFNGCFGCKLPCWAGKHGYLQRKMYKLADSGMHIPAATLHLDQLEWNRCL